MARRGRDTEHRQLDDNKNIKQRNQPPSPISKTIAKMSQTRNPAQLMNKQQQTSRITALERTTAETTGVGGRGGGGGVWWLRYVLLAIVLNCYYPFSKEVDVLAKPCMLVYMYILLFVCFHVLYISYMFRWPYGRLAVELNVTLLKYCINK